jgi:rod shape-determining protein MreD
MMRGIGGFLFGAVAVLLLRSTALSAFAVRGIVLDVLAFGTLVFALRNGPAWGCTFGFVLGLCADLDAAHWLGRHALVLTLLGYASGRIATTVVRESVRTQFALVFVAVAIHQAWTTLFEMGGLDAAPYLLSRTGMSALATAVAGTALLIIARRLSGGPLFGHASVQPGQAR